MVETTLSVTRRLTYQVVLHVPCGNHFQVRLIWHQPENGRYHVANAPCSTCDPQGRGVQPKFDSLGEAIEDAFTRNTQMRRI